MSFRSQSSPSYLTCPECGSPLSYERPLPARSSLNERRILRCDQRNHRFPEQLAVPHLLAPRYSRIVRRITKDPNGKHAHDMEAAADWLSRALELDLSAPGTPWSDRSLRRFLIKIARLLEAADEEGFTGTDVREVCSILSSEAMSQGYRQHVADPAVASMEAVNYEKYEDILLRRVISACLSDASAVALIELGSGPGRLLHQYGSAVSHRRNACVTYRRLGGQLYLPESLPGRERLRLVLGVDFAHDMLQSAARWLQRDRLTDLIQQGTIAQVCATVRDLPVAFEVPEWEDTTRVACILFQTLGNQIGRELQVEMLRVARRLVGARGVVLVSVFNAELFEEQGWSYYNSIAGSVGAPWYWGDRAFLSKRGVYSRWFEPSELRSLFSDAGMPGAKILDEHALRVFPEFDRYIPIESQEQYKRRALIGVYDCGISVDVAS